MFTIFPPDLFKVWGKVCLDYRFVWEVLTCLEAIDEFDLLRVNFECLLEIK